MLSHNLYLSYMADLPTDKYKNIGQVFEFFPGARRKCPSKPSVFYIETFIFLTFIYYIFANIPVYLQGFFINTTEKWTLHYQKSN